jgi:hypothetical protein
MSKLQGKRWQGQWMQRRGVRAACVTEEGQQLCLVVAKEFVVGVCCWSLLFVVVCDEKSAERRQRGRYCYCVVRRTGVTECVLRKTTTTLLSCCREGVCCCSLLFFVVCDENCVIRRAGVTECVLRKTPTTLSCCREGVCCCSLLFVVVCNEKSAGAGGSSAAGITTT